MQIGDVLTVGGASLIVVILVGAIKSAVVTFDSGRFGAILAIALGIVVVAVVNATAVTTLRLDWGTALITGILAGASAAGLYDAGRGAQRASRG